MSARVLALLILAAAPLGGCLVIEDKTLGESFDETTTGAEIKTRLFSQGAFSRFGEVDVEVANRFVLLSGRVPSDADKKEAERVAWSVSAVDEVANELVVEKRDLGRDVNDRWISEQVRTRLIAASAIKGVNYNVQVYDGVVFLLGLARSEEELRQAAETAARVKGVQKVVSYVKMRERMPEAIEADAKPPATQQQAAVAPPTDSQEPAPIVPPEKPATTRAQYGDPYAPGATPPPGAKPNSGGLQSAPLTPLKP
jgi:osmotically-inducible protein OsmY